MRCVFVLLAVLLASTAHAGVTDPALLFPPDTLAYVVVPRPGDTARSLVELLQPTPVVDPIQTAHDRLDRLADPQRLTGHQMAAWWGQLRSPELAAELGRLQGAAVGLLGFSARQQPRYAAVVLLGESHSAAWLARSLLVASPTIRRVSTESGVPIFQQHHFVARPMTEDVPLPGPAAPVKPVPVTAGVDVPTFAYTPGLFVIGSDVPAVADVLKRFLTRPASASLAKVPEWVRLQSSPSRGDLSGFVDLERLAPHLDTGSRSDTTGLSGTVAALVRFVGNPKAIRTLSGSVSLRDLTLNLEANPVPGVRSPLASILSASASSPQIQFGSRPAAQFTLALPSSDRRPAALLDFADGLARADGTLGPLPSERMSASGLVSFKDHLKQLQAVTLFGSPAKTSRGPRPGLILHLSSPEDATTWERSMPTWLGHLFSEGISLPTSSESIGPVTVTSLLHKSLPLERVWHLGRQDKMLVLGLDRETVAAACQATIRPGPADTIGSGSLTLFPWLAPQLPKQPDRKVDRLQVPESLEVGLARSTELLSPVTLSVSRTPATIRWQVSLMEAKPSIPKVFEAFLSWQAQQPADPVGGNRPGFLQIER